jgi:hypothetical protein
VSNELGVDARGDIDPAHEHLPPGLSIVGQPKLMQKRKEAAYGDLGCCGTTAPLPDRPLPRKSEPAAAVLTLYRRRYSSEVWYTDRHMTTRAVSAVAGLPREAQELIAEELLVRVSDFSQSQLSAVRYSLAGLAKVATRFVPNCSASLPSRASATATSVPTGLLL